MKRILVVTVNWLGDALLTTPVFQALKENIPGCYTAVLTEDRVKGVFEDNPYLDEIISFNGRRFKKSLKEKLRVVGEIKQGKFNTAYLIQRSFSRAAACWLAGIKERIGYRRLKNSFILTKKKTPAPLSTHRQDYYFRLFQETGINFTQKIPQFFIPQETQKEILPLINNIRAKYKYLAGINPCANWELKRWPAKRFAKLCGRLIYDFNCATILIGTQNNLKIIEEIIKNTPNTLYNMCGKTNLKQLGALIQNMDIFISNDSGPAHLSACLGVPTLVLFGPTAKEITSPIGKTVEIIQEITGCALPCYKLNCQNNICMKNISVERVLTETKKYLK